MMRVLSARSIVCASLLCSVVLPAVCAQTQDVTLLKSGNFGKARNYLERALTQDPNSASLHCNLGIALLRMRDYADALDHLHKSVGFEPSLSPAWMNLAACYVCLGEFDRAIGSYRKVAALQPGSAASIEQIIAVLQKAKSVDETAPDYFDPSWKRWNRGATIKLYIGDSTLSSYRPQFRTIAIDSLKQVASSCQAGLTVEVVPTPAQANVICEWIQLPESMAPLERGIATGKAINGKIVSGKVQIYLNNESGLNCITDDTIAKSCLHEFCHVLGIAGHSANVQDTMFALIESPTVEPKLSIRDKATLGRLYNTKD